MTKNNMFNLSRIGAKYSIVCILFILSALFFYTPSCNADALEKTLDEIVQDFERHIGNVSGETKYYVVVRSFIDSQTKKPKKISTEIEDTLVDKIVERFSDKKNVVVLERKRIEALEKEVAFEANEIHFKLGVLDRKLGKKLGAGFLITGTISKMSKSLKIRAEMVNIVTGQVLASSSGEVRLDEIDKTLINDYPITKTGKKAKNIERESRPGYPNVQNPSEPRMAQYCCDQFGNRRCLLFQPVPVGSPCFCVGQGWGIACE